MCITQCVFFLRVREDSFNRLLAPRVNFFRSIRSLYLFHEIQIRLPDIRRVCLLSLFICTAFRFARAVPALFRYAPVDPFSIPIRRGVPQNPTLQTGIGVVRWIVGIFPRFVSVLPPGVSCIWKHRDSSVLYRFLRGPRGLAAHVHRDELYFVEFLRYPIIYSIPCHAVVDISCRYFHTEDKPIFVADGMCLIRTFMLSFYEHMVRISCFTYHLPRVEFSYFRAARIAFK